MWAGIGVEAWASPAETGDRADLLVTDLLVPVVVPAVVVPLPAVPLAPDAKKFEVQKDKIYWGDAESFENPAVISAEKVYSQIPAYQRILEKGLTKDDPEYLPLMRKAAMAFVRAIKAVCDDEGHDLVGEIDSIQGDGVEVPDITAAAIAALGGE